jgi:hypothetical protein
MKRREFLTAASLAGIAGMSSLAAATLQGDRFVANATEGGDSKREYYRKTRDSHLLKSTPHRLIKVLACKIPTTAQK